jgi:hypothetical protein
MWEKDGKETEERRMCRSSQERLGVEEEKKQGGGACVSLQPREKRKENE